MLSRLEKLRALRNEGSLTEQEFLLLRESALGEITNATQTVPDIRLESGEAVPEKAVPPAMPGPAAKTSPLLPLLGVALGGLLGFLIGRALYSRPTVDPFILRGPASERPAQVGPASDPQIEEIRRKYSGQSP